MSKRYRMDTGVSTDKCAHYSTADNTSDAINFA